jgi:hypothetical protein
MVRLLALLALLWPVVAVAQPSSAPGCPPSNCTRPVNLSGGAVINGLAPVNGGTRPPYGSDDSTIPLPAGASWQANGLTLQSQDATAGYALWQQVQSAVLPLDSIGLFVSAAAIQAGGTSYVNGDTITLTGGVVLTVTNASGGVIQASGVSITTPNMFACAPSNPVAQLQTSGSGSGATFNLTLLKPTGYGMRLLTRCYAGKALNVVRSDTGEASDIGFLSDGSLDVATLDGFTSGGVPIAQYSVYSAGVNPRVAKWYDQGGGSNDATQSTAANRPVIFPGRLHGNSRSIMFDGRATSSWDPTSATFLALPAGVSLAGNNSTIATLAGVPSDNFQFVSLIHIGAQSSTPLIYLDVSPNGMQCQNNSSNKINGSGAPDEATFYLCTSGASATTFYVGNTVSTGAAGSSSTFSGGALGEVWNSTASFPMDESLVILVPWALTGAQQSALQASVAATFKAPPQREGVIVAVGDSHMEDWGYPYQQTLLRQAASMLGRPDISFVDTALAGAAISVFVGSSVLSNVVVPTLNAYDSNKFLLIEGGYNDLGGGQTVAQVEASYTSLAGTAHGVSAKVICDTDTVRNATLTINQNIQAIAAWMRATPSVCDYVFDPQKYSIFNAASGPWNLPWFEQQDSAHHLTAGGNSLAATILNGLLSTLIVK